MLDAVGDASCTMLVDCVDVAGDAAYEGNEDDVRVDSKVVIGDSVNLALYLVSEDDADVAGSTVIEDDVDVAS